MRRPHTAAPNKEPSARDSAEKALPRKNKGVHMPRFRLFRDDLDFILEQIKIAEENAAGVPLLSLVPNWDFQFGLRTLSGVNNNLLPFSAQFGAADNVFPRLATPPIFRTAEIQPANFFAPASPLPGGDHAALLRATQWLRLRLAAARHLQPDCGPARRHPGRLRSRVRSRPGRHPPPPRRCAEE